MAIRGKTLREKKIRGRVLRSLKAIRAEEAKGKALREATISAMKEQQWQKFGVKGKPFLEMPEEKALRKLDKRVLPGLGTRVGRKAVKATRKVFDRKKYYTKYRLIGRMFGGKGRLGIVMVKPELFSKRKAVEDFIKQIGCRVLFRKNFVFAKEDIQRLYPHALADREKYSRFSVPASYLMTSPSRVIVFEHLPVNRYKRKGREKKTRAEKPQDAFNQLFKDRMRAAISRPNLEELGFPKKSAKEIRGLAKELDVYGFFEKSVPKGRDPLIEINGVHVPDSVEALRDARTLLTITELERIEKKLK